MTSPSLAILICTMDRPETLRRCLASIAASDIAPSEVLVSDDSQDGQETAAVCAVFSSVRYIAGPRRGLCANRNEVIRQSTSDFVSLLDDDAIVSSDFIGRSFKIIANLNARILVTGAIVETDQLVVPGDPSFLGFFGKPPKNGRLQNINLNCNIFPRHVFNKAKFDEVIVYGYLFTTSVSRLYH